MLAIARSKIPSELENNVEIVNQDFMAANLEPQSFDLIICVGVLAHVESPAALLERIATLLKPGGEVIFELTDSRHWMGRLARTIGRIKMLLKPSRSPVNLLSFQAVALLFKRNRLQLASSFRYALLPLPGVPQNVRYRLVRVLYGDPRHNRNIGAGNEYICLLKK
jgi:2-polyprenyl-3-methyl-5-hydroxy-6-metoxy-1,4-benzoquinol methylase